MVGSVMIVILIISRFRRQNVVVVDDVVVDLTCGVDGDESVLLIRPVGDSAPQAVGSIPEVGPRGRAISEAMLL